ncbi:unnamed protein product [Mucor hiemalis]
MVHSIEVYLQPPSPTMNSSYKLPSVKSLFPASMDDDTNLQELPSIRLTNEDDDNVMNNNSNHSNHGLLTSSPRLNIIEPTPDLSLSNSLYQQSPIMTFSSPSSTTSSMAGSPLVSPIQDGPFLLPPPDSSFRRCRSVSNASNISSSSSSSYQFTFRSLSEPPTLNLPPSTTSDEDDRDTTTATGTSIDDCHPIFGPKRKRGRPPNASRPEVQGGSNWTFVKPTVWDVKHNQQQQQQQQQQQKQQTIEMTSISNPAYNHHPSSSIHSTKNNDTPQFYTENTVMSDGINTFTSTNMNMALSIPKKKRGRKPKKQLAGNSCFVWRDLTAPRGANKPKNNEKKDGNNNITAGSFQRDLSPADKKSNL